MQTPQISKSLGDLSHSLMKVLRWVSPWASRMNKDWIAGRSSIALEIWTRLLKVEAFESLASELKLEFDFDLTFYFSAAKI